MLNKHTGVVWSLFRGQSGEAEGTLGWGQGPGGWRGLGPPEPRAGGKHPRPWGGEEPSNFFWEGRTNSLFLTFYFASTGDSQAGVRMNAESSRSPSSALLMPTSCRAMGQHAALTHAAVGTSHRCIFSVLPARHPCPPLPRASGP